MKKLELTVLVNNKYDKEDIERIINSVNDAGSYLVKEATIEGVQYVKDKGFENNYKNMKPGYGYRAYEFDLFHFQYYALIQARTAKEAIRLYKETVAYIHDNHKPLRHDGIDEIYTVIHECSSSITKEDVKEMIKDAAPKLLMWDGRLE